MLAGGTTIPEVEVATVVAVTEVVEVDTVDVTVEVSVTVVNPPKAPKRSMVESGNVDPTGQVTEAPPVPAQDKLALLKLPDRPTIHPSLGEIM